MMYLARNWSETRADSQLERNEVDVQAPTSHAQIEEGGEGEGGGSLQQNVFVFEGGYGG